MIWITGFTQILKYSVTSLKGIFAVSFEVKTENPPKIPIVLSCR